MCEGTTLSFLSARKQQKNAKKLLCDGIHYQQGNEELYL